MGNIFGRKLCFECYEFEWHRGNAKITELSYRKRKSNFLKTSWLGPGFLICPFIFKNKVFHVPY